MNLKIVLEKGEDGYIVVHCPALKGCWSQGKTEQEAVKNIKEAITLYFEPNADFLKPAPDHKVLEVAVPETPLKTCLYLVKWLNEYLVRMWVVDNLKKELVK